MAQSCIVHVHRGSALTIMGRRVVESSPKLRRRYSEQKWHILKYVQWGKAIQEVQTGTMAIGSKCILLQSISTGRVSGLWELMRSAT